MNPDPLAPGAAIAGNHEVRVIILDCEVVGGESPAFGRPPAWVVNFWVENADAIAAAAHGLGGTVVAGPFDTAISRDAVIVDPSGAVFSVSTAPNQH